MIEQMREYHCNLSNAPYHSITNQDKDYRAKRITAYLDLLNQLVLQQIIELQAAPFEKGSDITHYYELLPKSPLKDIYNKMLSTENVKEKEHLQIKLRQLAIPGSIDVNIMTKLDRQTQNEVPHSSDALAALRGYANSSLDSSVVLSAGFNPRLYSYIANFKDFFPDENGYLQKRIILKVSDYRSAFIQGKYLAKRGLWVSEYRIESALNCGGHAFVNDGHLMGVILEEFKRKRTELINTLHGFYNKALASKNKPHMLEPHAVRFTAQGGVGTCLEHQFLLQHYELDAVGWGTPFLLVPEAINLDDEHLQKLVAATDQEITLGNGSPLGIPYWNLSTSVSEIARRERIKSGNPGSSCPKQYAKINSELISPPICTASCVYQKQKLRNILKSGLAKFQLKKLTERILAKACICHDLAAAATKKYGIDLKAKIAVCPGPNIINFSKVVTLEEMINHIYGRCSLPINIDRQHMFLKELAIYLDFFKNELKDSLLELASCSQKKLQSIKENLLNGIEYYRNFAQELFDEQRDNFIKDLNSLYTKLINQAKIFQNFRLVVSDLAP
ncbi:MAG: hypothetical protein PVG30_08635 [Gammaproteobacteria bacterium]